MVLAGYFGVSRVHLHRALFGCTAIAFAAMAGGQAQASSIAIIAAPAKTSSIVPGDAAESRSASVVEVAPPSASVGVLNAPSAKVQTLSPSVVALGEPVPSDVDRARVAGIEAPRDLPAAAMMPLVIRGGVVGNSFPNGGASYAPAAPEEVKRNPQPQVGNDGQPVADVSPGNVSSAPVTGGRVAPRVMAPPSSPGGGGGHGGGHRAPE
jgi:hypothetical protein